jgi:hypothetical protein
MVGNFLIGCVISASHEGLCSMGLATVINSSISNDDNIINNNNNNNINEY